VEPWTYEGDLTENVIGRAMFPSWQDGHRRLDRRRDRLGRSSGGQWLSKKKMDSNSGGIREKIQSEHFQQ